MQIYKQKDIKKAHPKGALHFFINSLVLTEEFATPKLKQALSLYFF